MYRSTVPAYHSFQVVLLIAANSAQAIPTHRHVQRREAGQSSRAEKQGREASDARKRGNVRSVKAKDKKESDSGHASTASTRATSSPLLFPSLSLPSLALPSLRPQTVRPRSPKTWFLVSSLSSLGRSFVPDKQGMGWPAFARPVGRLVPAFPLERSKSNSIIIISGIRTIIKLQSSFKHE